MKIIYTIIFGFIINNFSFSQSNPKFQPKNLIVAAENLNFRMFSSSSSEAISILENGELLTLEEKHLDKTDNDNENKDISQSWLKVKRNMTGQTGYVFGEFVLAQEMAYVDHHDADRLQKGNWYSIYQDSGKVKVERARPRIVEFDYGRSIVNKERNEIIICSQNLINEGVINGRLYQKSDEDVKIGSLISLPSTSQISFRLACVGAVELVNGQLEKKNEHIIFERSLFDRSPNYIQQDISLCLAKYGEMGYRIEFTGDLNGDSIPELIISEASNNYYSVYYFQSNEKGLLELQSITGMTSKC